MSIRPHPKGGLSEQELRVLSLMSHGYANREIAAALGLAFPTVGRHVSNILAELQASDRAHAVRIGFEDDLLKKSEHRRPRNARRGGGPRPPRASGGDR